MKQVWHRYETWEDFKFGMWRKITPEQERDALVAAVDFTGNHAEYGRAMIRVVNEWPISSEHNLTDKHQNQKAWVGHAAACLEKGIPEYITRRAWGMLSNIQQIKANEMAEMAIKHWSRIRLKKNYETRQMLLPI